MQTFSPSPAMLFPSMGRGADTAAPPAQDSFREVLASRLQAAMNSRDRAARANRRPDLGGAYLPARRQPERSWHQARHRGGVKHWCIPSDYSFPGKKDPGAGAPYPRQQAPNPGRIGSGHQPGAIHHFFQPKFPGQRRHRPAPVPARFPGLPAIFAGGVAENSPGAGAGRILLPGVRRPPPGRGGPAAHPIQFRGDEPHRR